MMSLNSSQFLLEFPNNMSPEERAKNRAYQRKYREKNPEYFRSQAKQWYAKYGQTHKRKFSEYKVAAKRRGLEFKLSLKEFSTIREKECFYCGDSTVVNGIDRVDNSKGYLIDNVVSCCSDCNFMKGKLTQQSFIDKCKKIADRS